MYGREAIIWKQKERSMVRIIQIDNLRGLQGIRKMDKVSNARIREFWGVTKGVHKWIGEGVLRWFGHVEKMENKMGKRVYVGE